MENKEFNLDDLTNGNGIEITKDNLKLVTALIQKQALHGIKDGSVLIIRTSKELDYFEIGDDVGIR